MPNSKSSSISSTQPPDPREIAAEIARRVLGATEADGDRAGLPYVVRVERIHTPHERLQLAAARLLKLPVALLPHRCASVDEWLARHRIEGPAVP